MSRQRSRVYPYLMWLLPLSFFSYQFILRLWPSLMMGQLMQQFAIDATAFGLLAALYYYGYAGMQLPLAVMLDRFGPRLVVTLCALICGLATFLFTYTDNWYLALFSRFMVGVGSAVGFLATSKVISQWFSKAQYARMVGLSFTGGLLGAIYGGKPVSLLVNDFGWQGVACTLGFVSLAISLMAFAFLRQPKQMNSHDNQPVRFSDLKKLLSTPVIWVLALANMLMVGSLEGFADVWGVNYLMTTYQMPKSEAAKLVSMIFVGMLFGGPFLAFLSKRFGNYLVITCCGFGMALALTILIASSVPLSTLVLTIMFFLVGIMCCYQVLMFSIGCDLVDTKLLGVTVAFLNSINMLGGSFFHMLIGKLMDVFWTGMLEEGVRIYTHSAYQNALLVIPVCAVIGATLVCLVRMKTTSKSELRDVLITDN